MLPHPLPQFSVGGRVTRVAAFTRVKLIYIALMCTSSISLQRFNADFLWCAASTVGRPWICSVAFILGLHPGRFPSFPLRLSLRYFSWKITEKSLAPHAPPQTLSTSWTAPGKRQSPGEPKARRQQDENKKGTEKIIVHAWWTGGRCFITCAT